MGLCKQFYFLQMYSKCLKLCILIVFTLGLLHEVVKHEATCSIYNVYSNENTSMELHANCHSNTSGLVFWSRLKCLSLNTMDSPLCSRGHNVNNITGPYDVDLLSYDEFMRLKYQHIRSRGLSVAATLAIAVTTMTEDDTEMAVTTERTSTVTRATRLTRGTRGSRKPFTRGSSKPFTRGTRGSRKPFIRGTRGSRRTRVTRVARISRWTRGTAVSKGAQLSRSTKSIYYRMLYKIEKALTGMESSLTLESISTLERLEWLERKNATTGKRILFPWTPICESHDNINSMWLCKMNMYITF